MKQILIILGLFASVSTFAQSPRIKLNQITKDTVNGSVLISSPSDSGMVYSRDFYVAYGSDTVLILYGDTLAATSGIISSVLSDGVTITGNGTSGNELKVDTSLIATIKALNDTLATISASTTPDGVTITGDGSVGNPLKVDTATVISTIQGLVDTLTNRGYLTANQTITISGDVTGSGTTAITATVVDDSHNHIISNVDFLQDSLNAKANDSDLANYVTLSGADTITGAKTFTNTFTQSGGDANFDSGTLYVDESENKVGIGTSSPQGFFSVERQFPSGTTLGLTVSDPRYEGVFQIKTSSSNSFMPTFEGYGGVEDSLLPIGVALQGSVDTSKDVSYATHGLIILQGREYDNFPLGAGPVENAPILAVKNFNNLLMKVEANGNVGIGTTSPSYQLQLSTNSAAKPTSNTWTIASDIRIKKNIVEYNKGLDVIMQINPIEYDYNGLGGFEEGYGGIGIIAQELKPILPEAINSYKAKLNPTDDFETDIMNFDSHPLTFVFINAIQEQQAQIETIQTELDAKSLIIETQEQKITDLETTIQSLITRIEILENK